VIKHILYVNLLVLLQTFKYACKKCVYTRSSRHDWDPPNAEVFTWAQKVSQYYCQYWGIYRRRAWSFMIIFVFEDFSSILSLWNSVSNTRFILAWPYYRWASLTVAQGAELKGAPNQFGTLRNIFSMFFLNRAREQYQQRGGVCLQFWNLLCQVDVWRLIYL
jgi:hypothetical protein